MFLQVTGHPSYGLPWGQDRLVPIFLATLAIRQQTPRITFESAAQMLDTFAMQQGGSQYRRLVGAFQRIFGATIFFGTDTQCERAAVVRRARFNFMSEARIWYSRDPDQKLLPGDCQNVIVLSDEFYREIPEPPDSDRSGGSQSAFIQSGSPRSVHVAFVSVFHCSGEGAGSVVWGFRTGQPVGKRGLCSTRKFREKLEVWLGLVRTMWPECPASIDSDGAGLFVDQASAVLPNGGNGAHV